MKKGVLLYTSYNGYNNTKYHKPTDEELRTILGVTNEILLIPIVTFNRFTMRDGSEKEVLTHEIIDTMTPDMVEDEARFETIKGEYHNTANHRLPPNYHVKDYVDDAVETAKRLVAMKSDVELWFSVPSAENFHAITFLFAEAWADTVDLIKNTLPESIWNDNVKGIYYAGEDITPYGYTKFDVTKKDFDNPVVYSQRVVSERVHSFGKKMLWIPYYHEASDSSKNLGHVLNLTDIFDVAIIQPSFFFNKARVDEIGIVAASVAAQAVLDKDGNIIGGKKTSKTLIGFEMEIDHQFYTDEDYQKRYYAYEQGFGKLVGSFPTAYYAGTPETLVKSADIIAKFFLR